MEGKSNVMPSPGVNVMESAFMRAYFGSTSTSQFPVGWEPIFLFFFLNSGFSHALYPAQSLSTTDMTGLSSPSGSSCGVSPANRGTAFWILGRQGSGPGG